MKNNDWYDVGEKIRDTVQSAVDSKDFRQLNNTINNAINGALDGMKNSMKNGVRPTEIYEPRESRRYRQYPNKEIQGNFRNANYGTVLSRKVNYDTKLFARFPAGRVAGPVMTSVGFSCMGLFLILAMSFSLGGLFSPIAAKGLLIASGFMWVFGIAGFCVGMAGVGLLKRVKRFRKYIQLLNGRAYCRIEELSTKFNKSKEFMIKDLKTMIQKDMFLQGHIDQQQTCLIVTKEAYDHYVETQDAMERKKAAEASIVQKTANPKLTEECRKILEEGNAYIRHIHECNEDIPGEEISEKLSSLEEIMIRIFDQVERNSGMASELHKFMNYYLPTTTKLVDVYRDLDRQSAVGQNVAATKKEIENTLDTINSAFENLLDRFFQDTAWDVSSDISVMKTMLAQEGLTKADFVMHQDQKQEN